MDHITHRGTDLGAQVDFLINRLNALEEHMKAVEEQMALELDHRQASTTDWTSSTIMLGSYASCDIASVRTACLANMYWDTC